VTLNDATASFNVAGSRLKKFAGERFVPSTVRSPGKRRVAPQRRFGPPKMIETQSLTS